jgi:hypothetical protein
MKASERASPVCLDKSFERSIPCLFDIVGKDTGRQLVHSQMILETGAAVALSRAPLVRTVAEAKILLQVVTIDGHLSPPFSGEGVYPKPLSLSSKKS